MGAYANGILANDEKVVYETKLHWSIFIIPAVLLLFTFLPLLAAPSVDGLILPAPFALWLVLTFLRYIGSEFVVTNKRLITKDGIISRKAADMNFSKIEGIGIDQGIIGRMLDFGSIGVRGTGGFVQSFPKIEKPFQLKRAVDEAMEAMKNKQ